MKRVLIITYYWPPTGGSGVQRWLKMSKYLPSLGWQPVIYTPSNPERSMTDGTLLKDIPPQAEILTHKILEPYTIFKAFLGKKNKDTGTGAVNPINGSANKSLKMRISLWIRANLFIPDPRITWLRPSVKFLTKYLKEHPVDAIVTTGPPQSMHLIGRELHRITGIKWIADFRDPWTRIFYFKHLPLTKASHRKHLQLEKKVLLEADKVVTVTRPIVDELKGIIRDGGGDRSKVQLIPNGYDEADYTEKVPQDELFTILHTGLFDANGNPLKLWKVLKGLCDKDPQFNSLMRLELIGKCDKEVLSSIEAAGLEEHLVIKGYRPHNEVNLRQQAAHALILPLRKEPESVGILTGKFPEYIAVGHPIIAFGPKGSALDKALEYSDAGRIFEWDEEKELEAYILTIFIKYLKDRGLETSSCQKLLNAATSEVPSYPTFIKEAAVTYSRRYQAEQYSRLLET